MFWVNIAHAESQFGAIKKNPEFVSLINKIMSVIVQPLLSVLFMLAITVFFWGVYGMIAHADDPAGRAEGQKHIMWGLIGLFIMLSVFGIIQVIGNTVNVNPFQ